MALPGMYHLVWLLSNRMGRGLVNGYKPNRISLYILLLMSSREDELLEILYKDMEQYKINPNNKGESDGK